MATKLKLIYFDLKGRAEALRLILYHGGVEFEDKRVSKEEFAKMKPDLPFGQFPVLELSPGEYLSQTMAIAEYVGQKAGLLPSDSLQRTQVKEFLLGVDEILTKVAKTLKLEGAEKKEAREQLASTELPHYLACLDKLIVKHGKGEVCVGEKVSVADFFLYCFLGWLKMGLLDHIPSNISEKHVHCEKVYKMVDELAKVKEWNSMPHGAAAAANVSA